MFDPLTLLFVVCLYVSILFVIALWVERGAPAGRRLAQSPVVYSLALAVYCTSWTFYGSVGNAATLGTLFLTIYLGPTLAIVLWWFLLRKLIRIKNAHRITSIADLISARYGKSQALAALATMLAIIGTMPYIALQLKAIISTFTQLTATGEPEGSVIVDHIGEIVVLLMTAFTISFGARRLDPTERHEGLLLALAVECVVKLVAFLTVGVFVSYFVFDGMGDVFQRLSESPFRHLLDTGRGDLTSAYTFMTYLVLGMSAIQFLPRQFHMAVVENSSEAHLRTAVWLFPLYMLLINLFVVPIAVGGLIAGLPVNQTDSFVLGLPMRHGNTWLSLVVFIGGFSAATGMIVVESMAVATMMTNHLLLPMIETFFGMLVDSGSQATTASMTKGLGLLRRSLLRIRWVAVGCILVTAYLFERAIGGSYTLVNMGIISFAAVLQFAPPIVGGLYWRRGNRAGALLGLGAGSLVWFYSLLLPSFVKSGWIGSSLLDDGPLGIGFLRPEQLFGLAGLHPVVHAVFWSFSFNLVLYVLGSLWFEQSEGERDTAEAFVGILSEGTAAPRLGNIETSVQVAQKLPVLEGLLNQYFAPAEAAGLVWRCQKVVGIGKKPRISVAALAELYGEVERVLAGSIGAAAAHKAVRLHLKYTPEEAETLAGVYSKILAELKVSPDELQKRVDYYQERTTLLEEHAAELQAKVADLKRAEEALRKAHDELEIRVHERTSELKLSNEHLTAEVHERERAEQELARSNAELEQFAYVASHDLQEPLRMVASYVQLLERRYKDKLDADADEFIGFAVDGAKRMQRLINDLLAYARIGTRGKPFAPTDSATVLGLAMANLRLAIQESGARVEHDGLPTVIGDGTQLVHLFQNLIGNAIKFRSKEPTIVSVRAELLDRDWIFSVRDNGIGIDPQYFERVFGLFQRLHSRSDYPGTGIGLALCKKIVERHGGNIWVESEVGQGATFYFTIPEEGGLE